MGTAILLLGGVGLLLGCWLEDLSISAWSAALSMLYALQLNLDAKEIAACLTADSTSLRRGRLGASSLSALMRSLDKLNLKLKTQDWQLQHQGALKQGSVSEDELRLEEKNSKSELIELLLSSCRTEVGASSAVLIERSQAASRVYSTQQVPARLEGALLSLMDELSDLAGGRGNHLVDGYQSSGAGSKITILGYRYSLLIFGAELCLWLGFLNGRCPGLDQRSKAERLLRELETKFYSLKAVHELESRISNQEQETRFRNQALSHVSHDLRSPIGNIKAVLSLLQLQSKLDSDGELVQVALKNCDDVCELVDTLIDYTRHRSGQLSKEVSIFDLRLLAEEIADSFKAAARLKGLEIKCEMPVEEVSVECDRRQIRRIVGNLLSNALKYTRKGGVVISLKSPIGGRVRLEVSDTGCGLSSEQLTEIFAPFTRFHRGEIEGIGLGLTVSKLLAELNLGQLEASSEVGRGSTFSLQLPCKDDVRRHKPYAQAKLEALSGLKILVVDHDSERAESLSCALEAQGCSVTRSFEVVDALAALNYESFDAVIGDAEMEDGGGRRIVDWVIQRRLACAVLILSSDGADRSDLLREGATAVFTRPIDLNKITDWLSKLRADGTVGRVSSTFPL
ncbi:MAG: hypothetical protein DCC75_00070 [Proteobacteria bacterium]|nr:MAG: hypothetical protein DCC75_00070 [Pseudomonadota bacterium]